MISRVKNVIVQANAVADVQEFYEALLGQRPEFVDGDRWAQFRVGNLTVAVAGATERISRERRGWSVAFEVPDLDDAVHRLAAAGGDLKERRDMGPHGRTAIVGDPIGNLIVLWQ